ncbi:MAG: LysR family transcriptional regulator [Myxococcota bacterium]
MTHWTEIRTAYQVARLGTVSAAAQYLGVHRATVVRHIDALEAAFGEKVFHRHTKGYAPTELGLGLMRVAEATERQFNQLIGRAKGREKELSGEFIITSVDAAAPVLMPVLSAFLSAHPNLILRYLSSRQVVRLEYGEAHAALRVGARPDHPDQVVKLFSELSLGLFASQSYLTKHGVPASSDEYRHHFFLDLDPDNRCAPCDEWIRAHVPDERISFRSTSSNVLEQALLAGLGIGLFPLLQAQRYDELVEVHVPDPAWTLPIWLVTHVDLHRSAKVRAFSTFLKNQGYLNGAAGTAASPVSPDAARLG